MLVLTRKKGERVLIGDDIVVTIIDIRGDGVRIGFDAPRGIPIQRAEVVAAVQEANAAAAETGQASAERLVGLLAAAAPKPTGPAAPAAEAVARAQAGEPDPATGEARPRV